MCHINYHSITLTCVFPTVFGAVFTSFSSTFIAGNIGNTDDNFYPGYVESLSPEVAGFLFCGSAAKDFESVKK